MVTLAFAQMAYYVVHDTPLGGGTDGIYLNVKPASRSAAGTLARPGAGRWSRLTTLHLGLAVAGVRLLPLLLRLALRPRAGRHPGQRAAHARHGLLDLPVQARRVHDLSGAIAGLAGFLFAVKDGFVNPELLSWHLSARC
jgi:branched-chain amino acid transport system permease protein